jgi:hypothetical protein
MPEFKNAKLGVSFRVPDRPTVRQQLAYFSEAGMAVGKAMFERLWLGALTMITDWQCDFFKEPEGGLEEVSDPRITEAILWASAKVQAHMNSLDDLPKA